jgi:hypothetical protein
LGAIAANAAPGNKIAKMMAVLGMEPPISGLVAGAGRDWLLEVKDVGKTTHSRYDNAQTTRGFAHILVAAGAGTPPKRCCGPFWDAHYRRLA